MSSFSSQPHILVVGASAPVLENVTSELKLLGYVARGTTSIERAATYFNARDFNFVAFGGGVVDTLREQLKEVYCEQNPAVKLLDVYAPTAVQTIVAAVEGVGPETDIDLEHYFDRIHYVGSRAPTLETLSAICVRHIDTIPFEAIDVLTGKGIDIAAQAIATKLLREKRGGYCLEHNPLLANVLRQLGYRVEGLSARVRWMVQPGSAVTARTHAALKVMIDDRSWLVDVGFGGAVIPQPLRMDTTEPQSTSHETYRLFPFGNMYRLQIQRREDWLTLYDVYDDPLSAADYEMMNWFTSRHPDSHFRHELLVARTASDRRYALRNERFTISAGGVVIEQRQLDLDSVEEVLAEYFGLPLAPDWRPKLKEITGLA